MLVIGSSSFIDLSLGAVSGSVDAPDVISYLGIQASKVYPDDLRQMKYDTVRTLY
jgi:hypothetical protein